MAPMVAAQVAMANPGLVKNLGMAWIVFMFILWCTILCCCAYCCHKFL